MAKPEMRNPTKKRPTLLPGLSWGENLSLTDLVPEDKILIDGIGHYFLKVNRVNLKTRFEYNAENHSIWNHRINKISYIWLRREDKIHYIILPGKEIPPL